MTVNPKKLFRNHFALLVGIDEYTDRWFDQLAGAYSDAETLYHVLPYIGYPEENLSLVPHEETGLGPLQEELLKFMEKIRRKRIQKQTPGSNPNVLLFWAGHGIPTENGSFLAVRDTRYNPEDQRSSALSVGWLVDQLTRVAPASLTMFFDVCHSDPPPYLPPERILPRMRDAVRGFGTFVGVSTFAYEVWDKSHLGRGRSVGILADAIQKGLRGEPCYKKDWEPCWDEDDGFVITDEFLVGKLKRVVKRVARANELHQLLIVVDHAEGATKLGFAVRPHALDVLERMDLPIKAKLLARAVFEKSEPVMSGITDFGIEMHKLVKELISRPATRDSFLRTQRDLVRGEIWKLRDDRRVGPYVIFLLYVYLVLCRDEVEHDSDAVAVLWKLYDYLISGDSREEFSEFLEKIAKVIALKHALPWSCGIRVLNGADEHGYAPIMFQGARITSGRRTFVTTSSFQLRARLEPWRGDARETSIRRLECCDYSAIGRFLTELPIGSLVWVEIGLDERNCPECRRESSEHVPMKISLGRDGCERPDWSGHWHLELGAGSDDLGGPLESVERVRMLMDVWSRLLAPGGDNPLSHQEEVTVVEWLYLADLVMRQRDRSRIEHVVEKLIIWLRNDQQRSVRRLAQRLWETMGMEGSPPSVAVSTGEAGETGEAADRTSRQVVEEIMAHYNQSRAAGMAATSADDEAELLALMLQAITADLGILGTIAEEVTELLLAEAADVAQLVDLAANRAVSAGRLVTGRLERAVVDFISLRSADLSSRQRSRLDAVASALRRDPGEAALGGFFERLRGSIRIGTVILAAGFLNATDRTSSWWREVEERIAQLGIGEDDSETREQAEEIHRKLYSVALDEIEDDRISEASIEFLLSLVALLWPETEALVVEVLTSEIDMRTAFRTVYAFVDPRRPVRGVSGMQEFFRELALWDLEAQLRSEVQDVVDRTSAAETHVEVPTSRDGPGSDIRVSDNGGWRDPMLLAIPPRGR